MSTATLAFASVALSAVVAAPAWCQERVGVVTAVIGPVSVTRASAPAAPLKFKDDIFLRDRVTTGEAAMTRILMGGKVVVTARERSTLTITEVPGLTTIDLSDGRIAVAVDKTRMQRNERVDVRTPNAIAGVRGTVLVVETQGKTSSVTVLRGLVDVVRLEPATGRATGPVTPVGARQAVTVRNNVLPPRPQTITQGRAQQLSQEFTPPIRSLDAAAVMPIKDEVTRATALVDELVPSRDRAVTATNAPIATAPTSARPSESTLSASASTRATTTLSSASTTTRAAVSGVPTTTLTSPVPTVAPSAVSSPTVPRTTTLVPPIVQPVVQPVVQPLVPVVQSVTAPVTNLVK
jgi:hypothetical protein